MSHQRSDGESHAAEITMNSTVADENPLRRRHSHHHHPHLHLKPAAMIDHIKTKVRRKRTSEINPTQLPEQINPNNNNNTKRFNTERNEIRTKITDATSYSLSNNSSPVSLQQHKRENNSIKRKEETGASMVDQNSSHGIIVNQNDEAEYSDEEAQNQLTPIVTEFNGHNNDQSKVIKRENKIIKPTKSLPDQLPRSGLKKRRQTLRRTGFQLRDEDFNMIFSNLPADEQLIIAYPCAWRKDVYMHGRMFLSLHYLCFYTCFFKWEESVCIAYKDIVSVTREKSAKVLPNAIQLRTKNQDQYSFASYIPRERIFITIFRLWQNALLQEPLNFQQLWTIVHEDNESTGDTDESNNGDPNGENSSMRHSNPELLPSNTSDRTIRLSASTTGISSIASAPSDVESVTYLSTCPCENHLARLMNDRTFPFYVDNLFEQIFGDNPFIQAFHASQKLSDYTLGEWHVNNETGKRERQVTYKALAQSILGTNSLTCTEKQMIEVEKPRTLYVINTEVYNEGMKYTDAFFVATRYCMFQRDAGQCTLRLSSEIRYVKSVNSLVKSFIEKNAIASVEEGFNTLLKRLDNQPGIQIHSNINTKTTSRSKRRDHKTENVSTNHHQKKASSVQSIPSQVEFQEPTPPVTTITNPSILVDLGIFAIFLLLFLHIYLCYKLYTFDEILFTSDTNHVNRCPIGCIPQP